MKKFVLSLLAVSLLIPTAFAGDGKSFKATKEVIVEEDCRFRDMEFQIDAFYTGFVGTPGSRLGTGSGGGFGVNFFFARYFGIGYEGAWYGNNGVGEHLPVGGNVFFRYPICSLNLAPYAMVGGGASWDGFGKGYGNVGGGLEYRLTNNIGLFGDSRYFYGGVGNVMNFRGGIRIAF